jgi:SAM-dependent methyltransferase
MRKQHLAYLKDPETFEPMNLAVSLEENDDHVISGILESGKNWYPIINGIPRLLIGKLKTNLLQVHQEFLGQHREALPEHIAKEWQSAIDAIPDLNRFWKHQKKTAESFAYEWKYIYKENDYEKQNFFHFLSPFVQEEHLNGKKTLDIGCGSGRFTKWAALSGTEVSFGSDLGETVEVAYEMTKDIPNACIVQADIYHMPFKNTFDLSYSIGVLHHLPKPQEGFSRLPKTLKEDGKMLIWVYNRRDNARALYFYEPLRALFRHLPKPILFKLCYIPGFGVHLINLFGKFLENIGLGNTAKKLPFAYYANFPFNMKLNDAFDVLATPKSNYYRVEEVKKWFSDAELKGIDAYEHPEAGITCIGIR